MADILGKMCVAGIKILSFKWKLKIWTSLLDLHKFFASSMLKKHGSATCIKYSHMVKIVRDRLKTPSKSHGGFAKIVWKQIYSHILKIINTILCPIHTKRTFPGTTYIMCNYHITQFNLTNSWRFLMNSFHTVKEIVYRFAIETRSKFLRKKDILLR